MAPRVRAGLCPPGVLCFTPGLVIGIAIAVVVCILFGLFLYRNAPTATETTLVLKEPREMAPPPAHAPINIHVEADAGGDDRYTRAPKPERSWLATPDLGMVANSSTVALGKMPAIATRGLPESYQAMGVVMQADGAALPLYGRRTASRSDRFQYYTRTDSYNPVPLPVRYKRRNCQDDVGCDELSDGDSIDIVPTGQSGTVTLYRFDGPTYIPGLL
jgi:hypothetical protein